MQKRQVNFARTMRCLALASLFIFALSLNAIVLATVIVTCPICGEKNTFYGFAGWGGYVYYYPSRFQMVFFPHTYPTALWTCKKCHYTAWIGDFQDLPPEKIAAVRKAVEGAPAIREFKDYAQVPMAARLAVAERVYRELHKDDLFWAKFYQLAGYHLGLCNRADDAKQARLKALDLLKRQVADPKYAGQKKHLLVALAAMHHFTGDDQAALDTLVLASTAPGTVDVNSKDDDGFLDKLISEYRDGIKFKSVPTDQQSLNFLPGIIAEHSIESAGHDRLWTVRACGDTGGPPKP